MQSFFKVTTGGTHNDSDKERSHTSALHISCFLPWS